VLRPEYLAQKLTPYPLPTKDAGVLRTIGDARAYMVALPKNRELRAHWQRACRVLLQQASAAALTRQVHLALFMDDKLDAGAFEHMSSARRWRRHSPFTNRLHDTRSEGVCAFVFRVGTLRHQLHASCAPYPEAEIG
jgi:hypothetical protein